VCSQDDIGNIAPPVYQKSDLPAQFVGKSCDLPCQFVSDNTIRRTLAAIELFDPPELFRSETADIAVYLIDGICLVLTGSLI